MTTQQRIDPRGPRFTASITAVLLLSVIALAVANLTVPATILFTVLVAIFGWSATQGVAKHPFGLFFRAVIKPRLTPPAELEDPTPPTFAQGVGFLITATGLALHLLGVPYALVVSASFAFIAAFLNAVFAYCLGCQVYLLLVRVRIIRPKGAAAA